MKRLIQFVVLAAVTAGLIFAGPSVVNAQPGQGRGLGPCGAGMGPGGPGFGGPGMMHGLSGLDLSDKQLEQVLDLQKDMQLKHYKLNRERMELMDELQTLNDDPEGNRDRLGEIQKRLDEMNLQIQKDRVAHEESMQKILTDEQWEELAMRKAERMKAFEDGDRPGRGWRGRGHGYGPHGPGTGWGNGTGDCWRR